LDRVILERGKPTAIRCDNGPEFTSRHFLVWCEKRQIRLVFIEPGRPMRKGHIETFNGRFRDECLNANWFLTLADAKAKIEAWKKEYNSERPDSSLGYLSPEEFAARQMPRGDSTGLMWGKGDSNAIPLPHTPIPAAREGSMTI
jgi:putative transposase